MRALLGLLVVCGCAAEPRLAAAPHERCTATTEAPRCVELTAADIGQLPLEVSVGNTRVSLAEWTTPDEASTQVVGFAAHTPDDVTFTVRAGPDEFAGSGPRWLHPAGVVGRNVHGIDAITFCQAAQVVRCETGTLPAVAMK